MTAGDFVLEQLVLLRREFFKSATNKQYFQQRPVLIQAITWPARWMNKRGAKLPASGYRRIIGTVISSIKQRGNVARIRRFSIYFLHSVQEHMKHHGDEYYEAAKDVRRIGQILPRLTASLGFDALKARHPDRTTEDLAKLNRVLRSPGGRRRKLQFSQPELPTFPPLKAEK